ncbi:MAG TPA: serine/threonine-protein kinase [Blastocatellia bacterium]|nr:serine/threonine-protein kinase [Blastocatellia bacterium]
MNRCTRCSGELPAFAVFCPHCAQAHEPNFDDLINLTIDGRYRIYRRLGQGGLSTIFAATDLETDRVVALKISDPAQLVLREMSYAMGSNRARDYWDEMLERMRREAETLASIDHPNIVRFDGTGTLNDDLRYVAMEFLRGRTLRDEIDRRACLESSMAVGIALELTSALIEVHSRGIVHRDINPRNIFICGNGVKLIDFGIAKFPQPPGAPPFTHHSTRAGTVAYASPEQCASHPVDHRSDIYSLGVVLYEMVTGQRPFNGRTPTEIALKQIKSEPKPPRSINSAIPAGLEKTILRALAKNPAERQQSAEELSEELRPSSNQILIPLAVTDPYAPDAPNAEDHSELTLGRNGVAPDLEFDASDETDEYKLKQVRRRRRRLVAAAAVALLAIIAAAALFGRPSGLVSRKPAVEAANVGADASLSPAAAPAIGSDADSLEVAANESAQNNRAAVPPNASAQTSPGSVQPTQSANSAPANNKTVARTAVPPTPSPAPVPIPPNAQPQMPPSPDPAIALNRPTHPESEPDLSQGPSKENGDGGWRRGDDQANNYPGRAPNGDVGRDSDRDDDHYSNRRRNNDTFNRRRLPDGPNRNESDREDRDDDDNYPAGIEPKVIQWSGIVNDEREVKILLPGVPGKVDVPRQFRHRVGIVEPPSANNRWRCAVLRVFGRGGVSFVIRFWPAARNVVKLTARS